MDLRLLAVCGLASVECATGAEGAVSGSSTTDAALESDSAAVPATGLATRTATLEAVETTVLSAATFTTAVEDSL